MEIVSIILTATQVLGAAFKAVGGVKTVGAIMVALAGLVGYQKDVHGKVRKKVFKTEQRSHAKHAHHDHHKK